MHPDALLALLEQVGAALKKARAASTLKACRAAYRAVRAGRAPLWSDEHVIELARILGVPGYEPLPRSPAHVCPFCPALGSAVYTRGSIGNVHVSACSTCRGMWVAISGPAFRDPT